MKNSNRLHLNDKQLRKLQKEQMILLKEFDRICRKHNIAYYLHAGTLLGAVRHGGFIPWDDDIDLSMFRNDYNKLKSIMEKEIDMKKFFFQNQETDQHYNWVFERLRLNNTVYKRVGQEHLKCHNGIFIDIFPLDNISENKFKQFFTINICKFFKKVLWSSVGIKQGRSIIHRTVFRLLNYIPRKLAITLYEYFAIDFNKKDSSLI